jgi:methionyl-tRNA formyltransferase
VFFGTPELAVPTLERLRAGPHRLAGVVSQPDRPRGRGRKLSPSPVAERALAAGLPLLRPERVGDGAVLAALRELAPDLAVVVAFGQFLPRAVRELPRLGYCINAHASLLPRHRGAAPIAHAILAGDAETGISVMRIEREMDAGAVCLVKRTPVGPDDTAGTLEQRLAALAADAVAEALDAIANGTVRWTPQDPALATFAPKLGPEDALLDPARPAAELARRVRALAPRPGASLQLGAETLRVLAAHAEPGPAGRPPGFVARAPGALRMATGDGWLVLDRLQRAGGRVLPAAEFLRGFDLPEGARLERPALRGRGRDAAD